jgi:hypothetical protein
MLSSFMGAVLLSINYILIWGLPCLQEEPTPNTQYIVVDEQGRLRLPATSTRRGVTVGPSGSINGGPSASAADSSRGAGAGRSRGGDERMGERWIYE